MDFRFAARKKFYVERWTFFITRTQYIRIYSLNARTFLNPKHFFQNFSPLLHLFLKNQSIARDATKTEKKKEEAHVHICRRSRHARFLFSIAMRIRPPPRCSPRRKRSWGKCSVDLLRLPPLLPRMLRLKSLLLLLLRREVIILRFENPP